MRKDRDDYITVMYDNIAKGNQAQFNICKSCDLQGLEYDIKSIMHYGAWTFSKNGEPTIVPKNGDLHSIGRATGFSELDKKGINMLYCNNCYDVSPDLCPGWNHDWSEGACDEEEFKDYMIQNCKKTCGYCEV